MVPLETSGQIAAARRRGLLQQELLRQQRLHERARRGDRSAARRPPRRDPARLRALRAHQDAPRSARRRSASTPSAATSSSATTPSSPSPAPASTTTRRSGCKEYNQRLSTLTTRFEKNLLADTNDLAVVFDDVGRARRAERRRDLRRGAGGRRARARRASTSSPSCCPPGTRTSPRSRTAEPRERIMAASRARGIRGGENDNRDLVLEITRLRAERAAPARLRHPRRVRHGRPDGEDPARPSPTCCGGSRPPPPATPAPSRPTCRQLDRRRRLRARGAGTGRSTPRRCAQAKYDVDVAALRP